MTNAEMHRRLACLTPVKLERLEKFVRQTSYTPRELADLTRTRLLYVNAVFQKVSQE